MVASFDFPTSIFGVFRETSNIGIVGADSPDKIIIEVVDSSDNTVITQVKGFVEKTEIDESFLSESEI
ncbi:MAG: hypothetical protein EBV23_11960, partial [Flavobacteriia bacterium]|nr:hypothetical protein [Flavobacteriia bacterium]